MIFWLDAQLPPGLAPWIEANFGIATMSVRDLGIQRAKDAEIFHTARAAKSVVVVSKDDDFVELVGRLGSPPQILWLTCGNTSNVRLRDVFEKELSQAITLLESGEPLVEISGGS